MSETFKLITKSWKKLSYLFAPNKVCAHGARPQSEVIILWECNLPSDDTYLSKTSVPRTAVLWGFGYFRHWLWAMVCQLWLKVCSLVQIFMLLPFTKSKVNSRRIFWHSPLNGRLPGNTRGWKKNDIDRGDSDIEYYTCRVFRKE